MKIRGICFVCGDADAEAEVGGDGVGWANAGQTLCASCVHLNHRARRRVREKALAELRPRLEIARDQWGALALRVNVLETEGAKEKSS